MLQRVLCLDIGARRIGVAVSDPLGITAQPLETIEYQHLDTLRDRLAVLLSQYTPSTVVVGLPLTMNGEVGVAVKRVRKLMRLLASTLGDIPVVEFDERFSTAAAQRVLLEGDVSRRRRKRVVDHVAASLILQGYLGATGAA